MSLDTASPLGTTGTPADAPGAGREAPVADWVSIPELYADPFPTFERLRSEGGVHWVPAIGRYLVTSYAAVHDTELDQQTFSADEQGSLMKRAMGHSMLRKDDPEHHAERRAWQPVLRPSKVKKSWLPIFERNAARYLRQMRAKGPQADLVWDFAAPFAAENLRAVTGLHNVTQEDLQRWSQTMIDATGNYADDPEVWARGEASFDEVDDALDEMLGWHRRHPDDSLLSALVAAPAHQMPVESIRANLKMTIGGGLNEPRDAIGVAAWALLQDPAQRSLTEADPSLWHAAFDEAIRWVAPIGMYSRQTTREVVLQGVRLPAGAKLGICLLSANRDETQWPDPDRFDLTRRDQGAHLAFGKGVHVCLGAWVARAEVADIALPALFRELPSLALDPQRPAVAGGWVFRGMDELPVTFGAPSSTAAPAPRVAVVGAGPAGCYTAQAVLRRLPDAQIAVLDTRPAPFGLVRCGVAPDHQGTKAVAAQFTRLFEHDGVRFIGSTRVHTGERAEDVVLHGRPAQAPPARRSQDVEGAELTLEQLRESFDAVVIATGLTADAPLGIPGAMVDGGLRDGIHGAGRVTRLLNGDPAECRQAALPALGRAAAVVGMGNVAMDVVRLAAKQAAELDGSDLHDAAHSALAAELRVLHVIGRSLPGQAKFDPVMLREILDLPGIEHSVHGVEPDPLEAAGDPRSELVAQLCRAASTGAPEADGARGQDPLRIHWWFGTAPVAVHGRPADGAVRSLSVRTGSAIAGSPLETELDVDSVVTAVGFRAGALDLIGQLATIDERARETGRLQPGLYVAGWARRGPRGTIPSQRADARELAEQIAADLTGDLAPDLEGDPGEELRQGPSWAPETGGRRRAGVVDLLPYLGRSTDWEGWRRIDAAERRGATAVRVRTKLHDAREQRLIACSAVRAPEAPDTARLGTRPGGGASALPPLSVLFATESGSSELVAEELASRLSERFDVTVRDIGALGTQDPATTLQRRVPHLVVCSTYGDGELPTSARAFHAALRDGATDLDGLRFAVFGLGDRSYRATYSRGAEILDAALRARGAERFGEIGRHDAAGPVPAIDAARVWAEDAVRALLAAPVTV